MRRPLFGLLRGGVLLAASVPVLSCSAAAPPPQKPLVLGVATHFDQRWPLTLLDKVAEVGVRSIRDDLPWGKGEPQPGHYVFDQGDSVFVRAACRKGVDVLLVVDPRNAAYDGGDTAHSAAAQAAFGKYINALVDFYGARCISAIEIGNEINSDGLHLPKGIDPIDTYAHLLAAVRDAVKPHHPDVAILGGSTNVIGTGFLEALFKAGALANMDGVVVHPYRDHPEGVDVELARVDAAMRRTGGHKPIWATEFGNQVDDARISASLLIRMLCMLSAAGVERAYWYALVDEPAYRNMGLYDSGSRIKPAGEAARAAVRYLSNGHRGVRVDAEDRNSFIFRFGPNTVVMWGTPRPVRFTGEAHFFDATGQSIPPIQRLSEEPVIVTGNFQYMLGRDEVIADSLYQFGGAPWSYFARRQNPPMQPLTMVDWTWTSYYGGPSLRPLELKSNSAIAAGNAGNPLDPTLRYTAPTESDALVSACLAKSKQGDGMRIGVFHNGKPIHSSVLVDHGAIDRLPVHLAKGDTLDFAFGPNGNAGGDALTYRIRLLTPGSKAVATCS